MTAAVIATLGAGAVSAHKVHAFKVADLTGNVLKGDSSVIGNMDRGGDVILPGFYDDALEGFRKSGFVAVGHDWYALPVAMPTKAEVQGTKLYCEAKFHSTQAAQDARTTAMERKEAGLDVGLSVGFSMAGTGYKTFKSGSALLEWATANGYSESDLDSEGIKAWTAPCRALIKCHELYEYSIVTVPMNPDALATEAKGFAGLPAVPPEEARKFWAPYGYTYDYETGSYTYIESTAANATVAALNQLYSDLCRDTADVLGDTGLTGEEMGAEVGDLFGRFARRGAAVVSALMTILADEDSADTKAAILAAVRKGATLAGHIAAPAATEQTETGEPDSDPTAELLFIESSIAALSADF